MTVTRSIYHHTSIKKIAELLDGHILVYDNQNELSIYDRCTGKKLQVVVINNIIDFIVLQNGNIVYCTDVCLGLLNAKLVFITSAAAQINRFVELSNNYLACVNVNSTGNILIYSADTLQIIKEHPFQYPIYNMHVSEQYFIVNHESKSEKANKKLVSSVMKLLPNGNLQLLGLYPGEGQAVIDDCLAFVYSCCRGVYFRNLKKPECIYRISKNAASILIPMLFSRKLFLWIHCSIESSFDDHYYPIENQHLLINREIGIEPSSNDEKHENYIGTQFKLKNDNKMSRYFIVCKNENYIIARDNFIEEYERPDQAHIREYKIELIRKEILSSMRSDMKDPVSILMDYLDIDVIIKPPKVTLKSKSLFFKAKNNWPEQEQEYKTNWPCVIS